MTEKTHSLDKALQNEIAQNFHKAFLRRLDPTLLDERPKPFTADWTDVSIPDSIELLSQLTRRLVKSGESKPWPLTHERLALRSTPLPFYGNALYVDVVLGHRIGWLGHCGFIIRDNRIHPMSTGSTELHQLNHHQCPYFEDETSAGLYFKLFCWDVCGSHGPFRIVDDIRFLEADCDADTRKQVEDNCHFEIYPSKDKPDYWSVKTQVYYNRQVFDTEFLIYPNGLVEMITDDAIIKFENPGFSWKVEPKIKYIQRD